MEALLGGLGVAGFGADAPSADNGCSSVEDLQAQLHSTLAPKRTETRAEHASATFQLRSGATVVINEEPPNARGEEVEQQPGEMRTRSIDVTETIQNQPADNPALQTAVAKYLASAIGTVDDGIWITREVSKTAQGWTFTYLCKHSLQCWKRQNAKKSGRPPIALFSGVGGQDPVNISRPAFDCRGTLTIAFSKSSRAIVVRYEHTPLHQTVAQLLDRLAPVIPSPSVPNPHQGVANRSTKARRPPPASGQESGRTKRQKNQDESANQSQTENGPGDQPPEAAPNRSSVPVNVPPAEAERRREIALNLLNGRGVDPATLSVEQFNIFANQAPNLQEVSLDMLAKYGAERLRIIHPEKEHEASASSASSQQATPTNETNTSSIPAANGAPATSVDGSAIAETTTPKVRRTRGACDTCKKNKRKCTKQHPQCSVCVELGETCVYLPPKPRRNRSTLSGPAVADDSGVGYEAGQVAQQGAEQEAEYGSYQAHEQEAGQVAQAEPPHNYTHPAPQPVIQRAETAPAAPTAPDLDNDEFIPDPNILSGPVDPPAPVQPSAPASRYESNVSDAPIAAHNLQAPSNPSPGSSRLSLSGMQIQKNVHPPAPESGFSNPPPIHAAHQPTGVSYPTPTITSQNTNPSMPGNDERHELPTAPSIHAQGVIDASTTNPAPPAVNWGNMPSLPANTNAGQPTPHTPSPTISYQTTNRPRSRKSAGEPKTRGPGTIQTAAAQPINSPPVNKSPHQNPGQQLSQHASLRQGHRAQTHTPVSQTPAHPPQAPPSYPPNPAGSYNHPTTTTGSNPIPTYNPYARMDISSNDPYSKTGTSQTTRIAYEPHSYKQAPPKPNTAYSSNSYGYSRGGSSANTLNYALHGPTDYSTGASGNPNVWDGSRDRNLPSSNSQYGMRSTDRQGTGSDTSYNQPTQQPAQSQQSYRSFSQQSDAHTHQATNWQGFTSVNQHTNSAGGEDTGPRGPVYSGVSAAANTGYNQGQRGAAPGYHEYEHEYDLYDLMRTGGSH